MNSQSKFTIEEISQLLAEQVFEFANNTTKTILQGNQSSFNKLFSRFSNNPEKHRQRLKLNYHLLIAYLAVTLVELKTSSNFSHYSQQILDGMVELFYESIKESSKEIDAGLVIGDEFIKDQEERDIVMQELKQHDSKYSNLTGLPRIGLTAVTDFLLEKRLNEYWQIWSSDLQRLEQPGFIALMPSKVYQHWSGLDYKTTEGLSFNLLLFHGLMGFANSLSQAITLLGVKTPKETHPLSVEWSSKVVRIEKGKLKTLAGQHLTDISDCLINGGEGWLIIIGIPNNYPQIQSNNSYILELSGYQELIIQPIIVPYSQMETSEKIAVKFQLLGEWR